LRVLLGDDVPAADHAAFLEPAHDLGGPLLGIEMDSEVLHVLELAAVRNSAVREPTVRQEHEVLVRLEMVSRNETPGVTCCRRASVWMLVAQVAAEVGEDAVGGRGREGQQLIAVLHPHLGLGHDHGN
jgi:hypothetical protein